MVNHTFHRRRMMKSPLHPLFPPKIRWQKIVPYVLSRRNIPLYHFLPLLNWAPLHQTIALLKLIISHLLLSLVLSEAYFYLCHWHHYHRPVKVYLANGKYDLCQVRSTCINSTLGSPLCNFFPWVQSASHSICEKASGWWNNPPTAEARGQHIEGEKRGDRKP